MSQTEEFEKIVEAAKANKGGVVFVTGKPGSGKSKVLREAAEDKKWDYVDCRMLISEDFLAVPGDQRMEKAPELMGATLDSYNSDVILLDRLQTLFVPVFRLDVGSLLRTLGQKYVLVAAWPGYVKDNTLCYDKFDGTESIRIPVDGFTIWNVE
ncbi:MAG: BREX-3 system P-loop-containing protein BrxF [Succiniclasticum sp.]|jgi:hypothetical protein|nr:BREX-3 system P-loop-containing protein BrxF [Succiniclasticum sp.]MEE3479972.1 BREX-3 system P-loop-containing protein BrxF [Succiniclasticum sp.]